MNRYVNILLLGTLLGIPAKALEVDKASGYFNIKYDYYGQSEAYYEPDITSTTNNGNEGARLEFTGKMSTFKNQWFEYRVREYQNLVRKNSGNAKRSTGNDTRIRYYFRHNSLYNGKIGNDTRLEYRSLYTSNLEQLVISEVFNLSKIMPEGNDYFKIISLSLMPGYEYRFKGPETDYHVHRLKLDIGYRFVLPLKFELNGTLYLSQNFYSDEARPITETTTTKPGTTTKTTVKKADNSLFTASLEMYLTRNWNLYNYNEYSLDLKFIGGLDSMGYNGYKSYNTIISTNETTLLKDDFQASIYAFPHLSLNYSPSTNLSVYIAAGAEYRNWKYTSFNNMKDWTWQGRAIVGMNRKF